MTNGMYPELITRPDIKIFLPPIGGLTIYIWGDPDTIPDEDIELTCRVHDECNGSDVSLILCHISSFLTEYTHMTHITTSHLNRFSAQIFAPVVLTLHMPSKSASKLLKEVDVES
jgi:hypothetical protein